MSNAIVAASIQGQLCPWVKRRRPAGSAWYVEGLAEASTPAPAWCWNLLRGSWLQMFARPKMSCR